MLVDSRQAQTWAEENTTWQNKQNYHRERLPSVWVSPSATSIICSGQQSYLLDDGKEGGLSPLLQWKPD